MSLSSFFVGAGSKIADMGLSFLKSNPVEQAASSIPKSVSSSGLGGAVSYGANLIQTAGANIASAQKAVAVADRAPNVGLFGQVKNKVSSLTSNVTNLFKTKSSVSNIKDSLTGFGTNTAATVTGWLDNTISTGLDKVSSSLFDKLYPQERVQNPVNYQNVPSVTQDPYLMTPTEQGTGLGFLPSGTGVGFIPTNTDPLSVPNQIANVPQGLNSNLMIPFIIGLIIFLMIPKKGK